MNWKFKRRNWSFSSDYLRSSLLGKWENMGSLGRKRWGIGQIASLLFCQARSSKLCSFSSLLPPNSFILRAPLLLFPTCSQTPKPCQRLTSLHVAPVLWTYLFAAIMALSELAILMVSPLECELCEGRPCLFILCPHCLAHSRCSVKVCSHA